MCWEPELGACCRQSHSETQQSTPALLWVRCVCDCESMPVCVKDAAAARQVHAHFVRPVGCPAQRPKGWSCASPET